MTLNLSTKLVFALEHVAHLHDLIEGNEWEHHLNQSLTTFEHELKDTIDVNDDGLYDELVDNVTHQTKEVI